MKVTARMLLWPILAIGVALVAMPFVISLPGKASAGQKMIDSFHPIMQASAVQKTVEYYDSTFTALGPVASGGVVAAGEIPGLFGDLATSLHMTQPQLAQFLSASFPAMAQLLQEFPQLVPIFKNVPPGLAWYKPLVSTMQANVNNYAQISSLPNFNLFTWFFVIPGVLLALLAGAAIVLGRRSERSTASQPGLLSVGTTS